MGSELHVPQVALPVVPAPLVDALEAVAFPVVVSDDAGRALWSNRATLQVQAGSGRSLQTLPTDLLALVGDVRAVALPSGWIAWLGAPAGDGAARDAALVQAALRALAAGRAGTLPPRLREVADLLRAGLRPKEIAARLGISAGTARGHVAAVRAALGDAWVPRARVTPARRPPRENLG